MPTKTLKTVVFMGSAKTVVPFWGGDARLGDRVVSWVKEILTSRSKELGSDTIKHDFTVVDPVEVFGDGGALAEISNGALSTPTFFLKELPPKAQALKETICGADCYLVVSPEYNHAVPPALASVMGHFGGSCYACKPSAILTYSPGPFAGMRAAVAICTMCHELGCLPVSKLCGLPNTEGLLDSDGKPKEGSERLLKQLPAMLDQLEWMAVAMKRQRDETGVC
ncbi:NADPH-dependent FMN reductase [Seminavis robusta]|uniref:NADPH-dependent FMN reductase n=1 Tax=Seminavis robusta TaxID=568900 RepID=A0A9N8E2U6_9STRA|nr:NADPH-dependent FMN reductase [Seminavis robusta]|eukprot:Sro448_g145110.1 NADPH-dependent FMN reductase (224) ;mRNA; r:22706-23496